MGEPLHEFLRVAENAVDEDDEQTFWRAIGDNVMLVWSYGSGGDQWCISKLLIDIWADAETQRTFSASLDVQFERWIRVIEAGKSLGWVNSELDTYALIASCRGASNGQAIFSGSTKIHYTPETVRDFWLEIAIAKK